MNYAHHQHISRCKPVLLIFHTNRLTFEALVTIFSLYLSLSLLVFLPCVRTCLCACVRVCVCVCGVVVVVGLFVCLFVYLFSRCFWFVLCFICRLYLLIVKHCCN